MSKHTPTPWSFVAGEGTDNWDIEGGLGGFKGANGESVCSFGNSTQYYPSCGSPPNEADRAFIVRAVNAHDQLVAACMKALELLVGLENDTGTVAHSLGTAIAKAKGE